MLQKLLPPPEEATRSQVIDHIGACWVCGVSAMECITSLRDDNLVNHHWTEMHNNFFRSMTKIKKGPEIEQEKWRKRNLKRG